MPSWLADGLKFAITAAVVGWLARLLWRRLGRYTMRDANAKHGATIDWRGFFGRRR